MQDGSGMSATDLSSRLISLIFWCWHSWEVEIIDQDRRMFPDDGGTCDEDFLDNDDENSDGVDDNMDQDAS
jgi:hypothetical protein